MLELRWGLVSESFNNKANKTNKPNKIIRLTRSIILIMNKVLFIGDYGAIVGEEV